MITIKLLGGAKKAVGDSSLTYKKARASITEIFSFLQKNAVSSSEILKPDNILVAINGVEASTLAGNDTMVEEGDIVTIVPISHGG